MPQAWKQTRRREQPTSELQKLSTVVIGAAMSYSPSAVSRFDKSQLKGAGLPLSVSSSHESAQQIRLLFNRRFTGRKRLLRTLAWRVNQAQAVVLRVARGEFFQELGQSDANRLDGVRVVRVGWSSDFLKKGSLSEQSSPLCVRLTNKFRQQVL